MPLKMNVILFIRELQPNSVFSPEKFVFVTQLFARDRVSWRPPYDYYTLEIFIYSDVVIFLGFFS